MRVAIWSAAILLAATAALTSAAPAPVPRASSYLLIDSTTGEVLASKASTARRPMASTTKMMTALLTLEAGRLERAVVVPRSAVAVGQSSAGLVAGERIATRHLLTGLLIGSGNDAAIALANGLGPGQAAFVAKMNDRARQLGLADTHFMNPHGLDAAGHHSSARDLTILARTLMANPTARAIVRNRRAIIPGPDGVGRRNLISENTLLSIDSEADGVKTGHTAGAGYAMVAHARRARTATGLYLTLLGEPSLDARAFDARRLLRWGFAQYARTVVIAAQRPVARAAVRDQANVFVNIGVLSPVLATIRAGSPLTERVVAAAEVRGPVAIGDRLGKVEILSGGYTVARADLVALSVVDAPSLIDRGQSAFGNLVP